MGDDVKEGQQETEVPQQEQQGQAPAYVSVEDFRRLQDQVTGQFEVLMNTMQRFAAPQQAAPQSSNEVGDEELQTALLTGDVGAVKKLLANEREKIVREYIAPLQQIGIGAIADINQKLVRQEMPYYELVQQDMEKQLGAIAPELRMQPQVIKHIYNATLGANLDKVVNNAIERKLRAEREGSSQDVAGRRTDSRAEGTSVEGFFGDDAMKSLHALGRGGVDADTFARKLGYKDAKDYLEFALKQEQEGA